MDDQTLHAGITAPAAHHGKRIRIKPFEPTFEEISEHRGADAYEERMAKQRREWRLQDERKFYNPEHAVPASQDPDDTVWNVYAWRDSKGRTAGAMSWHFMGSRPVRKGRRKPMTMNRLFAALRQRFGVARDTPLLLVSKRDDHGNHPAPKHRDTLRPHAAPAAAVAVSPTVAPHLTRHRKNRAPKLELVKRTDSAGRVTFTVRTRYVAFGRRDGSKGGGWTYLGPCQATTKAKGRAEIEHRYPLYPTVTLFQVSSLSYSLRVRLMNGSILPGTTKMHLPEAR